MPNAIPQAVPADEALRLDGTWEGSGRSLNSSALLGLLGIGIVYFNGQSILAMAAVALVAAFGGSPGPSGISFDGFLQSFRMYVEPLRIVIFATQVGLMLLPTLWIVKRWHSSDIRGYVRLTRSSIVDIILAVLITLCLLPAGNFIADEFTRQLHIPEKLLEINAELFTARSPVEFLWLIVVVCVTPALCEELFFRGYIQRTFERTIAWRSFVLVGVLFGLFHFNPLGLITLSVLGILFGYFYYRSRSLAPSMAAHFTNNFVAISVLYGLSDSNGVSGGGSIPLWLVGVTLPIGAGLLYAYQRLTAFRFSSSRSHEIRA